MSFVDGKAVACTPAAPECRRVAGMLAAQLQGESQSETLQGSFLILLLRARFRGGCGDACWSVLEHYSGGDLIPVLPARSGAAGVRDLAVGEQQL
eukprot:scaffold248383_cov32-Tisochrysis_lutea.AAC.2